MDSFLDFWAQETWTDEDTGIEYWLDEDGDPDFNDPVIYLSEWLTDLGFGSDEKIKKLKNKYY
jgi:hypothetical protein